MRGECILVHWSLYPPSQSLLVWVVHGSGGLLKDTQEWAWAKTDVTNGSGFDFDLDGVGKMQS